MSQHAGPGRDVLRAERGEVLLAPSILAADFSRLGEQCRAAVQAGARVLHLDVMDGHFVPNLTMGPALCASLRRELPGVCFDVHLMVTRPEMFVEPFVKAGADHITFHAEVIDQPGGRALAERIRGLGCTAGIALNPSTPLGLVEDWLGAFDLLLVMSVQPGFAGQAFMPEVLAKTRAARRGPGAGLWIQMDGGIGSQNAGMVREAGCDVLVTGSAFFGLPVQQWARFSADVTGEPGSSKSVF